MSKSHGGDGDRLRRATIQTCYYLTAAIAGASGDALSASLPIACGGKTIDSVAKKQLLRHRLMQINNLYQVNQMMKSAQ
ncbi:MAG: hypothetical protein AB7I42_02165 [Bradyrhizobium sp.]|uniref:hypothetical protein n=1 Tax=Bradyrhizobium sp. TaxID=376 RepID=UPI003542EE3D